MPQTWMVRLWHGRPACATHGQDALFTSCRVGTFLELVYEMYDVQPGAAGKEIRTMQMTYKRVK